MRCRIAPLLTVSKLVRLVRLTSKPCSKAAHPEQSVPGHMVAEATAVTSTCKVWHLVPGAYPEGWLLLNPLGVLSKPLKSCDYGISEVIPCVCTI